MSEFDGFPYIHPGLLAKDPGAQGNTTVQATGEAFPGIALAPLG